jgi:hypothetical protein
MTELEKRANELFAAARGWNPVDRSMLERVAERLEAKPRGIPWLPAAALLAFAVLLHASVPPAEPLAEAPAHTPPSFESKRLTAPPKLASRRPAVRPKREVLRPLLVEQPAPQADILAPIAAQDPPARDRYVPRAIADFQRMEEDDELRAFIQWLLVKPDATVCR